MAVLTRSTPIANRNRRIAVVAACIAIVHLTIVPRGFHAAPYIGALYLFATALAATLAVGAWHDEGSTDVLAILIGSAYAAAYVASRVVGMPGVSRPSWTALGDVSLALDLVLVVAAVIGEPSLRRASPSRGPR
ncbi:MAG: hypothetical protein AB7L13_00100 [Acidimicrobiia bacterium]